MHKRKGVGSIPPRRPITSRRIGLLGRAVHLPPPLTSSFLNFFRLALVYVSLFNICLSTICVSFLAVLLN